MELYYMAAAGSSHWGAPVDPKLSGPNFFLQTAAKRLLLPSLSARPPRYLPSTRPSRSRFASRESVSETFNRPSGKEEARKRKKKNFFPPSTSPVKEAFQGSLPPLPRGPKMASYTSLGPRSPAASFFFTHQGRSLPHPAQTVLGLALNFEAAFLSLSPPFF